MCEKIVYILLLSFIEYNATKSFPYYNKIVLLSGKYFYGHYQL